MPAILARLGDRIRRWSRELWWVASGQLFGVLGSFALIKVLTQELDPHAYGELALGLTMAGALHMFIYGPIEQTALRFVSKYRDLGQLSHFRVQLVRLHRRLGGWLMATGTVAGILVLWFAGRRWGLLLVAAVAFGVLGGAVATMTSVLNGLRERRIVAFHQGADPWVRLVFSTLAVLLLPAAGWTALMAFAVGSLVILGSQFLFTTRRCPDLHSRPAIHANSENREFLGHLTSYGLPFTAFALFATISAYADRWLLLARLDESSVGVYAAALQIANAPMLLLSGITTQLVVPVIFERTSLADRVSDPRSFQRLIAVSLGVYGTAAATLTVAAYIYGSELMLLVTSPEFAVHGGILWIVALGLSLANAGQILVLKGLAQGKSGRYLVPKAVQSCALLGSALPLIGRFGIEGMAWALALSSACYIIAVAWTNQRMETRK